VSEDIWYSEDVQRIILAAVQANEEALGAGLMGTDQARMRAYHQGFRAALSTVALALGLPTLPLAPVEECSTADNSLRLSADPVC
jgi:hypothetical protein